MESSLASELTDFVIFRLPLVYGPGCVGNFQRLLRFVRSSPINPFCLFTQRRSFLAVQNLCSAFLLSLDNSSVLNQTFLF